MWAVTRRNNAISIQPFVRWIQKNSVLDIAVEPIAGSTTRICGIHTRAINNIPNCKLDVRTHLKEDKDESLIRSYSPFFVEHSHSRAWHDPEFLRNASVEASEAWLNALLLTNDSSTINSTSDKKSDSVVDAEAYFVVLRSLSTFSNSHGGAPQRAEEWMSRFERYFSLQDMLQNPDVVVECYNCVIEAWANSREDPNLYVIRAERWLSKLIKLQDTSENLGPNTNSINLLLSACSRGRTGGGSKKVRENQRAAHAEKAQQLLEYMMNEWESHGRKSRIVPNTASFNYVLRAWSRCRDTKDATDRIMHILKLMEQCQRDDPDHPIAKPDNFSYCMAMDAWANQAGRKSRSYQKHSRTSSENDNDNNGLYEVGQVEAILKYMHDLYDAGHEEVVPNTVAYNTLLSAWNRLAGSERHPNATFRAEEVLRRMKILHQEGLEEVKPDHLSYTKVIQAWASAKRENSGARAIWWLKRLWEEYDSDGDERMCPQVSTYNTVIKSITASGDPMEAENLLKELMRHESEGIHNQLGPNSETFSYVINGWLKKERDLRSNLAPGDCCRRAASWLDELIAREESGNDNVLSSVELFSGILKTCKHSSIAGDTELLDLALSTFDKFRASRHHVDHFSYTWMLQLGLVTLAESKYNEMRTSFVTQLVHDCCDDGLISSQFVKSLANGPVFFDGWTIEESARITQELFGDFQLGAAQREGPSRTEISRNIKEVHFWPVWEDTRRKVFDIRSN